MTVSRYLVTLSHLRTIQQCAFEWWISESLNGRGSVQCVRSVTKLSPLWNQSVSWQTARAGWRLCLVTTYAAHYHVIPQTGLFSVVDWRQVGGRVLPLRTCSRSHRRDNWRDFLCAVSLFFFFQSQTRERRGVRHGVKTRRNAERNIFPPDTEIKKRGNCAWLSANETHRPGKEGGRVDRAAEAASALQQLRNSVKNANVRVGGGTERQALDAEKSAPGVTPFATSTSDRSLSNTGVDTEWEGERERETEQSRVLMQLLFLKKKKQPKSSNCTIKHTKKEIVE